MTTTTAPNPIRRPRLTATIAATAAIVVVLWWGAANPGNEAAMAPTTIEHSATSGTAFQIMSDLTPVVSPQLADPTGSGTAFQVMSDLTPVVSAQLADPTGSSTAFQVMSDLTPVVSAHFVGAEPPASDNVVSGADTSVMQAQEDMAIPAG